MNEDVSPDQAGGAGTVDFPIVTLGASAGGLAALTAFFQRVPDASGMAYVVIEHLAPDQVSALPELLGRETTMDTATIEDGQAPLADHVYVIPPDRSLSFDGGVFRLEPRENCHRLPIDYFLRSLAAAVGPRACAVILSGTGTDGTLGIAAVKAAEGMIAVQQPETAAYDGMPRSAEGTGLADVVLPVEDIPAALVASAHGAMANLDMASLTKAMQGPSTEYDAILGLLRKRTGRDFTGYKPSSVLRRIARRMAVHGINGRSQYLRLLGETPEELDRLFADLLIPVTGFFRDPQAYAVIAERVIPALLARADGGSGVRVWVAGCSTGEEAYSLAILLSEAMDGIGHRLPVQIFATDIDTRALDKARRGRYPANIAVDVGPERLQRFFTRSGDQYEVIRYIREMVIFAAHDVARDPPFSRLDLVTCRNLLIYFGTDLQTRTLANIHYALNPDGFLFLGSTETVGTCDDLFAPVDSKIRLFARRADGMARHRVPGIPLSRSTTSDAGDLKARAAREAAGSPDHGALVRQLVLRHFSPAAVLIDSDNRVLYVQGSTGDFMEPATGRPSVDMLRMLRVGLGAAVRGCIDRARRQRGETPEAIASVSLRGRQETVRVRAMAVRDAGLAPGAVLVLFEPGGAQPEQAQPEQAQPEQAQPEQVQPAETGEHAEELERELGDTRERLHATVEELETSNEELQSTNEELQSSNEELQSSNEELETSREELQSVNEELGTTNAQLSAKVDELARTTEDIDNLMASTAIGIVLVDRHLCIQRYTPAVEPIIPIIQGDIGRPIAQLSHNLEYQDLVPDLEQVVARLVPMERRLRGRDGHQYMVRMRPYKASDDSTVGAVLVFIDITDEEHLAFLERLEDALGQAQDMVVLLSLDEGSVEYVNQAFCDTTGYRAEEIVGKPTAALAGDDGGGPIDRRLNRELGSGRSWIGELAIAHRDGGTLATRAFLAPIRTAGSGVTHAVAYLQPVEHDA